MEQALANEERAIQRRREMETPQAQASDMTYGANGITKENGYIRDSDGKITYVGVKKWKEYVAVKPHASLREELNCIWTPVPP